MKKPAFLLFYPHSWKNFCAKHEKNHEEAINSYWPIILALTSSNKL